MILSELTPLSDEALPLSAFKAHLRLGSGFGEDSLQDEVLLAFLRASLAAIETRISKALLIREFELGMSHWPASGALRLPVAPVTELSGLSVVDAAGDATDWDLANLHLMQDQHSPLVEPLTGHWPSLPTGGAARLRFLAGLAGSWVGVPADLAQAVFLLATHYYEFRHDTTLHAGCMPFGVVSLIDRHRLPRLGLGASHGSALGAMG